MEMMSSLIYSKRIPLYTSSNSTLYSRNKHIWKVNDVIEIKIYETLGI